jgi:CobQ-like glutamine amidotransferase family enzyme
VAVVHPDLLGTYGDGGNGVVLAERLRWRGIRAEVVEIRSGDPVPATCDVYCLGGGEDGPEARSALELLDGRPLDRAVAGGAVVLAVCAGFQVVGEEFAGADGRPRPGLGLLDVRTRKGGGTRAVGEVVAEPVPGAVGGGERRLPPLTGYENHGAVTELGSGVRPLARVRVGVGNGAGDGTEGAVTGKVVGTYLHGPVLARNPALADVLLSWVVGGTDGDALAPLDDAEVDELRRERLAAAPGLAAPRPGLVGRLRQRVDALRS